MNTPHLQKQKSPPVLLIVALTYWILVMGMWGIFALHRGLTYETAFPLNCGKSLYECLIYIDNLRPYNSLFLGMAHLLGGSNGSYVSYQILYGLLWWGRGWLIFLIFRRIFPDSTLFAFLVGVIAIVHASDYALNWIGQLHQFGFMFFLALAAYWFIVAWQAARKMSAFLWLIGSLLALYISLWTYESQFFIILILPLLLFLSYAKLNSRFLIFSLIWYVIPTIYSILQFQRYQINQSSTYQTSILRPDLNLSSMVTDLGTHLLRSLSFWSWGKAISSAPEQAIAVWVSILCCSAFVIGCSLLATYPTLRLDKLPEKKSLIIILLCGALLLVLSFPVYLLIAGNTQFWRTQMLSSFAAAIALVASICLLGTICFKRAKRQMLFITILCTCIVFSGVKAGVELQKLHGDMWQTQRQLMSQITWLIPDVKDNSLILLANLSKTPGKDPFGASMWFDLPIELLYPNRKVAGHFFYADGQQPTDDHWAFTEVGIKRTKPGFAKKVESAQYNEIIALNYDEKTAKLTILPALPKELIAKFTNSSSYNPYSRIEKSFIPEASTRMFAR